MNTHGFSQPNTFQSKFCAGFTLVELMIAVGIIALLASLVFSNLGGSKARSRDSVRLTDIKNIGLASENYFAEHGRFPSGISDIVPYFGSDIPVDPLGNEYLYIGREHSFCVATDMETGIKSPTPDDDPDCPSDIGKNYIIKGP
jgi:prepilin-type N-terminal cleavage/methylation domain-containing protein